MAENRNSISVPVPGFNAYVYELSHRWIKTVLMIGGFLVPTFSILDYIIVPGTLFPSFIALRFGSSVVIAILYLILRFTKPGGKSLAYGYMMMLATAVPIAVMTVLLGGFSSGYYAGLNLVIIGTNLFLPWHYLHTALNGLMVVVLYVTLNLAFAPAPELAGVINNLFFMLSMLILAVAISWVRYSLLRDEFRLRNALSDAQVDEFRELAGLAKIVASGDLTVRVETRSSSTAGTLEAAFDTMVRNLHDVVSQISEMAFSVSAYSADIKKNADSMMAGALEQMARTKSTTGIIGDMNRVILENAKKSEAIDDMAAEAARTATAGGSFIDEAAGSMGRIVAVVRRSADQVQSLRNSSLRIGEIVASIEDIADKTNLLSLNAAIEAARAGEHGRGFAIVAQEVSKLADVTAKATGEISSMISSISDDIRSVAASMDDTSREVDGSAVLIQKMHDSMRDIVTISENLRALIGQMAGESREQAAAAERADTAIEDVGTITVRQTGLIEKITATIGDMSALTDNLARTVQRFRLG